MNNRELLITKYAADLKDKCGVTPDIELLTLVTIGCGPTIYNNDASIIASSQKSEVDTVKNNFLIQKLGLADTPELDEALNSVFEKYGKSNNHKYRAVVYYLLTVHFKKESIYK